MKSAEKPKPKCISQQTWLDKYPSEERDSQELYWKYLQKRNQSAPAAKSSRAPRAEPIASYYSSASSYKPQRNYALPNPAYLKYASAEGSAQNSQDYGKTKEKRYPGNAALPRKNRYDAEFEENERTKYSDEEQGNFTEENAEDEGEDEDEQEEATAFAGKDYEEHEADDEIDEESDASPQTQKLNRVARKEPLLRSQQRWNGNTVDQQRRLRYQQVPLGQDYLSPARYYRTVAEHEASEPVSEDDFVPPAKPGLKRQDYGRWIQSRSSTDRRELIQGARKARTKPEIDRFAEPEYEKLRQCSRCGSFGKRAPVAVRHRCRFDECPSFPTRGPIGDEPEIRGHSYCGRCVPRQNLEGIAGACDIPTSGGYPTKPRRSREVKSPIHEVLEQRPIGKANDYTRLAARYPADVTGAFLEKSKRSVHTTHAPPRLSSRYTEHNGKQAR